MIGVLDVFSKVMLWAFAMLILSPLWAGASVAVFAHPAPGFWIVGGVVAYAMGKMRWLW